MSEPYDYVAALITYEEGYMDKDSQNVLFQYLVDTGIINSLQGSYGRTAARMIEEGEING